MADTANSVADLVRKLKADGTTEEADDAARALLREHGEFIRRLARIEGCRHFDASDLVQTVLRRVVELARRDRIQADTPEKLRALLGAIARNHCRKAWRKKGVPQAPPGQAEQQPAGGDRPSHRAAVADEVRWVNDRLNEDERLLAELKAGGLGWPEIGRRVGMSADAARKKLERARDRLQAQEGGAA